MSVPIKKSQYENVVKFIWLPFVATFCTVDSTSFTVTESDIHVKSCKAHMTSSRKIKNVHIEDFQNYFSLCKKQICHNLPPKGPVVTDHGVSYDTLFSYAIRANY